MKQHIRSQFLIKRFSDNQNKMDIFNIKEGVISFNKKSEKIFFEDDIYPLNIEDNLNKQLENKVALLFDKKILNKEQIILTREELLLLKKFLIVESIRTNTPDHFLVIMKGFSNNVIQTEKIYSNLIDKNSFQKIDNLPSINELNLNSNQLYNNILEVCIKMDNIDDILSDNLIHLATKEIYFWIRAFYAQYIVFLDANNEQEFIFSDNGMTSEYEPSRLLLDGYDLSKLSYLKYQMDKATKEKDLSSFEYYLSIFKDIKLVYENFSIFNLSAKRTIALVNPFFKLYTNELTSKGIKEPDIWPSCISNKNDILVQPDVQYCISRIFLDSNDKFLYNPKKLNLYDTIYINVLFLRSVHKEFGFLNFDKIKDSLYAYETIIYLDIVTTPKAEWDKKKNIIIRNMFNNNIKILFEKYKDKYDLKPILDPFWLSAHLKESSDNDIKNNYYLLDYLLNFKDQIIKNPVFGIFGEPSERIKNIKSMIKKVKHSD